jgi:hypothetical protein
MSHVRSPQHCLQHSVMQRTSDVAQVYLLTASCWFLAWLTLRSWRWKRYVPPKRRVTLTRVHCTTLRIFVIGCRYGVHLIQFCAKIYFRDQSVLKATGRVNGVRFSAEATDCSLFHSVQAGSGAHPASFPMGTGGGAGVLSPLVKRPEREAGHSFLCSAEVKNSGAIPPLQRMSSWCGVSLNGFWE